LGCYEETLKRKSKTSKERIRCEIDKDSSTSSDGGFMEMGKMNQSSFPKESSRRRVILVLQEHDVEKCVYEPDVGRNLLLDEEIYVLHYPVKHESEAPSALKNILDSDQVRPGAMLLQSPFDREVYEDALVAPQRFALAKHMYFSTLCMYLGAKSVSVTQVAIETQDGKTTFNVAANRNGVGGGKVNIENERLKSFVNSMQLEDHFVGGPPDVNAAENMMRRTGLWTDHNLRTLLAMRSAGGNQLLSRKLVLNLSSELKSNLNVAARVNVPSFVKFSSDYNRVVREKYEFSLTVLVEF